MLKPPHQAATAAMGRLARPLVASAAWVAEGPRATR